MSSRDGDFQTRTLNGAGITQFWLCCRYSLEELHCFLDEARECIPGTAEAIAAAFDREANPVWPWPACIEFCMPYTGTGVL